MSSISAAPGLSFSVSRRSDRGWRTAVIMVTPALALFTVFIVLPIISAAQYSFFNWNGLGAVPSADRFVGFANFGQLLNNTTFTHSVFNNLLIIAVSLFVQLPLALGIAALVAERRFGAVTFRLIFFLPFILADVAAGLIWAFMFDGDSGLLTAISQAFGGPRFYLLAIPNYAVIAILITVIWKYFGFYMMLYVAGMQNVDPNLHEAAAIDGATTWQRFRFVTVPGILPTIRLSVLFSLLGSLQFFDLVVPLTRGGPLNTTHTIVSFLYYFGLGRMRVGFGAAVGIVLFVSCVAVAYCYRRWIMRDD